MKYSIASLLMLVVFSSITANAAQLVKESDMHKFEQIGVVSVSGVRGSTDDAIQKLSKEADEKGAEFMHITSLGTSGDSSLFHGSAVIFK